jgi:hypothetical protein
MPLKPEPRGLPAQLIRSHAIRAAAQFLSTVDDASDDDLFKLAGRIARYIEGRHDGR